ncbi:MAG: alpha/beta hydrolase [Parasphingopyxis sp.]|uniref:alpha/beta hydrolase n=1 Tax=Parasphingopyxis sp. TaxID=1920299 RepID=UPI002629BE16|nr:alpha/beta hydrolase [uncultured Parasphingopyxis sp.]
MTDPYVRPDVQMVLSLLEQQEGPKLYEIEPAAARQLMLMMGNLLELEAGEIAVKRDLSIPGPAGNIPARLYDPRESREPGPLLVYYHGGGFVIGDLETHDSLCCEIARVLDMPVVSIDYRLAPEHPFPAAPEDCISATRWIADSPEALGRQVTGLVLAGDSAGGNLAIVCAIALRDEPAAVPVLAMWPIYPATDLDAEGGSMSEFGKGFLLEAASMDYFVEHYAADSSDWRANPSLKDAAGLPPAVLITAGLDPLRDQGRAYAGKLIDAGVPTVYREAKGNIHGFANLRKGVPSSQADIAGCLTALKALIVEAEGERVMEQAAE